VHLCKLSCLSEALDEAGEGGFVTTKDTCNDVIGNVLLLDEAQCDEAGLSTEVGTCHEGREMGEEKRREEGEGNKGHSA
jgi:hypothetical protein